MIDEKNARKYCREDITLIKNYAEAVADTTQTWICHHINAEPFTGFCKEDLIKMNMYENRPASELMFVTRSEHTSIHFKSVLHSEEHRKKISESRKGKHPSEETRKKMSESHKGKHHSEEHRQKLSESNKGKRRSIKTRKKMAEANKDKMLGRHWYNNGFVNAFAKSCPEGFVEGRIR